MYLCLKICFFLYAALYKEPSSGDRRCDDVGIQTDIGHEGKCSCQLMIKKKAKQNHLFAALYETAD